MPHSQKRVHTSLSSNKQSCKQAFTTPLDDSHVYKTSHTAYVLDCDDNLVHTRATNTCTFGNESATPITFKLHGFDYNEISSFISYMKDSTWGFTNFGDDEEASAHFFKSDQSYDIVKTRNYLHEAVLRGANIGVCTTRGHLRHHLAAMLNQRYGLLHQPVTQFYGPNVINLSDFHGAKHGGCAFDKVLRPQIEHSKHEPTPGIYYTRTRNLLKTHMSYSWSLLTNKKGYTYAKLSSGEKKLCSLLHFVRQGYRHIHFFDDMREILDAVEKGLQKDGFKVLKTTDSKECKVYHKKELDVCMHLYDTSTWTNMTQDDKHKWSVADGTIKQNSDTIYTWISQLNQALDNGNRLPSNRRKEYQDYLQKMKNYNKWVMSKIH